jgi:hypothetical protein
MIFTKKNKKYFIGQLSDRITSIAFAGLVLVGSCISASADTKTAEHNICPEQNAAQSGSAADEYTLALAYDKGYCGIAANQPAALQWYTRAAQHGSMLAQYQLGEIYYTGNGVAPDYPEAKKWYLAAAKQGDGHAQWRLGFLCAEGHYKGLKTDYNEAEQWWTKAAEQNADDAQFRLGNFYHTYKNPPDMKKSVYWLTRASEGGNRVAMFDLARMLKAGEGTPKNPEQALIWMKKSAELGMPTAQMMLSEMYATGDGVEKDPAQSLAWTLKVAAAPSAIPYWIDKAADILFAGSKAVPQNYPQALILYTRAAAKGDPHAEARLGRMYMEGLGVAADPKKARAYLNQSAGAE